MAGKCQHQNRKNARKELERIVTNKLTKKQNTEQFNTRMKKMGSGQRGDKIRTYREQDNLCITRSGRKVKLKSVLKGLIEDLG